MGCGAVVGGVSLEDVDVDKESIIQGQVVRDGVPVGGAYVRLHDKDGEFTAEMPTSDAGEFRFFAAPGRWTVRTLAPGTEPVDRAVVASLGNIAELTITI
jgi:Protein of unknown function (DUF1416)